MEALNPVTGNVDKPGGLLFNQGILDMNLLSKAAAGFKKRRSHIGGFPYLSNSYPAYEISRAILMDSPDEVKPEWEIFRELSRHMGVPVLNQWPKELKKQLGEYFRGREPSSIESWRPKALRSNSLRGANCEGFREVRV